MIAKLILGLALAGVIYLWWRGRAAGPKKLPPGEARALLGVSEEATLEEIREAHRRLISKVHPDAGGSSELATRVNAARDALVDELKRSGRLS